jgi:hypothetical protein
VVWSGVGVDAQLVVAGGDGDDLGAVVHLDAVGVQVSGERVGQFGYRSATSRVTSVPESSSRARRPALIPASLPPTMSSRISVRPGVR